MTAYLHYSDGTTTTAEIPKASNHIEVARWYLSDKDNEFLSNHKIVPFEKDEQLAAPVVHRFKLNHFLDGYPHYNEIE